MTVTERCFLVILFVFLFNISKGQQTPFSPVSYLVFSPSIYNPAAAGSKDFSYLGLICSFQDESRSQILNWNTRLPKKIPGYNYNHEIKDFSNVGIGASAFNDMIGSTQNMGLSANGSYQIPLSSRRLSFLSVGVALKGIYNIQDTGTMESANTSKETFYQDLDVGMYYFGSSFFSGISATNLLENPKETDAYGNHTHPIVRQYYFTMGYKILLSRRYNIVLEPSVLVSACDTNISNIAENIYPILKLYMEYFCVGSYFLNEGNISFFLEYRYPRFFVGAFFELPKKTPYYKSYPLLEFTAGFNFTGNKRTIARHSHW